MKHRTGEIRAESGSSPRRSQARFLLVLGLLTSALVWASWDTGACLVKAWWNRPAYSHGFFVVPFAGWLLWQRFQQSGGKTGPAHFVGLVVLALALSLQWFGAKYFYNFLGAASIVPAMAGIVIIAGGLAAIRWSWPAVLMLFFMVPLPYQLETALEGPLRSIGTAATVFVMQSAGMDVVAEGHVIVSEEMRIGVEEACSGLSMLLTFVFLSTAVVFVGRPPLLESAILLASAVPIALISNVLRITTVGVLYEFHDPELAELVHEYAAFLMMPAAMGMLWAETLVLSRLFVTEVQKPIGLFWGQTESAGGPVPSCLRPVPESDPVQEQSAAGTMSHAVREEIPSWRVNTIAAPH